MKLFKAFLQLIRWQNLLFIFLTQSLLQYSVFNSLVPANYADVLRFSYLLIATILISAAGYIINDYFDINIDQINKPQKLIINKFINRRWAIALHSALSFLGLVFTFFAVYKTPGWYLFIANFFSVILLWFYSTHFKKQALIGNFVIALLTAWSILIIYFSKYPAISSTFYTQGQQLKFLRICFLYAGFAFIVSIVREAIKDLEDIEGDEKFGCKTMPVVWGVQATKLYSLVWLIILLCMLLVLFFYFSQFGWWVSILYGLVCIFIPVIFIVKKIQKAQCKMHYSQLSSYIKWLMLSGIVSMLFFICA